MYGFSRPPQPAGWFTIALSRETIPPMNIIPTSKRKRTLWWSAALLVVSVAGGTIIVVQHGSNERSSERDAVSRSDPVSKPDGEPLVSVVPLDPSGRPRTAVERQAEKYDALEDDWPTEVLNEQAAVQLKALGKLVENPQQIDLEHTRPLVSDDFSCEPALKPANPVEVFRDGRFVVRTWAGSESAQPPAAGGRRGPQAMVDALRALVEDLGEGQGAASARDIRTKLKLFRLDRSDGFFTTKIYYEASQRTARRGVQQNATWQCHWRYPDQESQEPPRLSRITLEAYEQVTIDAPGGKLFVDGTESAMAGTAAYAQQVLPSINHWLPRISKLDGMNLMGHSGLAVADINGDGLDDLYVCDNGGLPNRIYAQNPDGTVTDMSGGSGVDWLEDSAGVLLVDLDNDGDQDLVVSSESTVLFARNDGRGRFTPVGKHGDLGYATSLCAADYDGDSYLDVYVCAYGNDYDHGGAHSPIPYHDANNGTPNVLFRNDGSFQFSDVTAEVGLDHNNSRFSFAAAWEDYDNDGDLDLYVANDFGRNNLYRNDEGHFRDVAGQTGVEDTAAGMSVAWDDYNRDGWMDLYVGNMFSAAGERVTYQRRFVEGDAQRSAPSYQRMARGNTLFANNADPDATGFDDVSEAAGVFMGRWSWSSRFADFNNDTWPDLVVTNGYLTNADPGDL